MSLKPLPKEDEQSIKDGMKLSGLSDYLTATIRLGEYESQCGNRVICATLTLETTQSLSPEGQEVFSSVDRLRYLGNHIGQAMQYEMSKQLPCHSIGDKVIMSREDYNLLRKGIYRFREGG